MNNNILSLQNEFQRIKKMGWVPSLRRGSSGIGYTFETLLNKKEDNFEIPDYKGIEIKTKQKFSKRNIKLFCATPDGDWLFPIKTLIETFGYPDEDLSNARIFNGTVTSDVFEPIGSHYLFKLSVEKNKRLIRLIAIDLNCNLVNNEITWSFDMLEQKLKRKLQYLAIIHAYKKTKNKQTYFKYDQISFYKLKSFDMFIKLIEDGIINIKFSIGVFKVGKRYGETHDHGTQFTINEKNIFKLYNKIS